MIAVGNTSTGFTTSGSAGSELTISHTVASGDSRLIAVTVLLRDSTITVDQVQWNGTNLTRARQDVNTSAGLTSEVWYLIAPEVGTYNITVQISANDQLRAYVVDFTGVAQVSPVDTSNGDNAGNSASISDSVTTTGEAAIVDALIHEDRDTVTKGASQTYISTGNFDEGQYATGSSYRIETSASTYAMDWTAVRSDTYAHTVVAFAPNTPPTVALNSPSDTGSTSDTTPDLTFTGTDADSDDIRYQLQLAEADPSYALTFNGSTQYMTLTTLGSLGSNMGSGFYIKFKIKTSSTTKGYFGTLNDGGTTGVQIIPNSDYTEAQSSGKIGFWIRSENGLAISGATTNDTGFNDGNEHTIEIICDTSAKTITIKVDGTSESVTYLQQNTPSTYANFGYAFAMGARNNRGSFDNYFACTLDDIQIGTTSSTLYGEYYMDEGTGSTAADSSGNNYDATLVNSPTWADDLTAPILIDVVSGTDSGFSGSPDNTDPFTSGQAVTYTVQAGDALTAGNTYYWKVRGIDPSGSNTYGAWSSTYSFSITAGGSVDLSAMMGHVLISGGLM